MPGPVPEGRFLLTTVHVHSTHTCLLLTTACICPPLTVYSHRACGRIPFYSELKLVFLLWLALPQTKARVCTPSHMVPCQE